jgi:hypothetical protein
VIEVIAEVERHNPTIASMSFAELLPRAMQVL